MEKIKEMMSNMSYIVKKMFKKFPITLAIIILITLFLTITVKQEFFNEDKIWKVFIFGTILSIEVLFIETYFTKKHLKLFIIGIAAIISYMFTIMIYNTKDHILSENIARILFGCLAALFLLSLYKISKKENVNFKEYILKIFANSFSSIIVYGILNIGITLLSLIFIELILDGHYGYFIIRTQILMLGLFYVPAMLHAISDVSNKEVNSFIKGIIKYVLLPLVTLGVVIIYLYIIKILVLSEMPSNIIFRILAAIYILAFPIWNMAENFKENNKIIEKTTKLLPYLYMPFILLEIYSLGIRIIQFGITPARYLGIMFIILQIISLILTVMKNKKKLSQIFIYLAILIFISFVAPVINYNTVSLVSQKNILTKYVKESTKYEDLSKEDKERVYEIYVYLSINYGEENIPEYIKAIKEEIYNDNIYSNNYPNEGQIKDYINFQDDSNSINIQKYSKMMKISEYERNGNVKIQIYDKERNNVATVNLESLVKEAIKRNKVSENDSLEYIRENNLVKIDDSKELYLINFYIRYDNKTDNVQYVSIDGYLLEK